MHDVCIKKLKTKYQLPRRALVEQRRLDQLRTTVLDRAFTLAAERVGLRDDSQLCIRRVNAPVHLRLEMADESLMAEWSSALSREIVTAVKTGAGSNVVLYHSRRQAVIDLVMSVAQNDFRRSWAWQQLGFWRGVTSSESAAIADLARALCSEPALVVPALRSLAGNGWLGRIARPLSDGQWKALAFAALQETGAADLLNGTTTGVATPRAVRDALRALNNSSILQAITSTRSLSGASPVVRQSIAALVLLETEPILVLTERAPLVLKLIAEAMLSLHQEPVSASVSELYETAVIRDSELPAISLQPTEEEEAAPLDLRRRGFTRFGGLLLLLALIDELNLPEEILGHTALSSRSFIWTIYRLGLALLTKETALETAIEPDDPAVLAFAGLAPDGQSPSLTEPAPSSTEAEVIRGFATRIGERLQALLGNRDDEQPGRRDLVEERAQTALEFVCHRPAEIVADPGWIEVRFSLDEVATEIRRAGLDLDPGYVSWLGVVVKFVYE